MAVMAVTNLCFVSGGFSVTAWVKGIHQFRSPVFMHPSVFIVLLYHLVLAMYFFTLWAYYIRQYLSAISIAFITFLFFPKKTKSKCCALNSTCTIERLKIQHHQLKMNKNDNLGN